MLGTYYLNTLFEVLRDLHFINDPVALWNMVLDRACKVLQAEHGTLFILDGKRRELTVAGAFGIDASRLHEVSLPWGRGLCGWVAEYNQPLVCADAQKDPRFSPVVDKISGIKTRTALAVPVASRDHVYGVIELVNRKTGAFAEQDKEFLALMGREAGLFYHDILMLKEVERTKVLVESTLASLTSGFIGIDAERLVNLFNPAAAELLGLPCPVPAGTPLEQALAAYPAVQQILCQTLESRQGAQRQELLLTVAGQEVLFGYTTTVIRNGEELLGIGMIFQRLKR